MGSVEAKWKLAWFSQLCFSFTTVHGFAITVTSFQQPMVQSHHSPFPLWLPRLLPWVGVHHHAAWTDQHSKLFLTTELTSYVVLVSIIQLFYSSVTESQLPHPVNPSSYTCWQTKVCTTCSCMEAISCKTVGTANTQNTVKINTMYSCKRSNYLIFKKKKKKKCCILP